MSVNPLLPNLPSYTSAEIAAMYPEGYRVMKVGTLDLSKAKNVEPLPTHQSGNVCTLQDKYVPGTRADIDLSKMQPMKIIGTDDPVTYTRESALKDVFSKRFSRIHLVNIDGNLSAITSQNFKIVPDAGDLDSLEKQLQESGTVPLAWDDFDAVVTRYNTINTGGPNALTKTTDALAAHYVAQKSIITSHFEGDELAVQLDKLERSFGRQSDRLANEYVENLSEFLTENGASGLEEKLRASVHAAIDEAVKNYEAKAAADPGLLKPGEGKDAWLNTHLKYVASRLQVAGQDRTTTVSQTEELFSLAELEIASRTVGKYRGHIQNGVSETGAMNLALLEMETDTAMRLKGASSDFRQMMNTIRDNAIPKALDTMDKKLANHRANYNPKGEKPEWWSALDRTTFQKLYDATMAAYRKDGDALGAIRDGAAVAKQAITQLVQDGGKAMRWTNAIRTYGYFDSFYGAEGTYANVVKGGYQNYVNQWQGFLNELGKM